MSPEFENHDGSPFLILDAAVVHPVVLCGGANHRAGGRIVGACGTKKTWSEVLVPTTESCNKSSYSARFFYIQPKVCRYHCRAHFQFQLMSWSTIGLLNLIIVLGWGFNVLDLQCLAFSF